MKNAPSSQNYRESLLQMIEKFLDGRLSFEQFEEQYYPFYVDAVPDGALSDSEAAFFGTVQERLDWTAEAPPPEDRAYGWINRSEYRDWLSASLPRFKSGSPVEW